MTFWAKLQEWGLCREALLPAIEMTKGEWDEDVVIAGILADKYTLWRVNSSALVLEIFDAPRKRCLNVLFAGGDLEDIKTLKDRLQIHAVRNGCTRIKALFCRRGWEKALGDGVELIGWAAYKDL